jgi:hypothetical protein
MRPILKIILLLFLFTSGKAQQRKNYFPCWSFHQKNADIHGISIGIGSTLNNFKNTNTNGIRLELIGAGIVVPLIPYSPITETDSSEYRYPVSEKINGINISLSGTVCDGVVNGLSIGTVGNIIYKVNGVSVIGFLNFVHVSNGIQFAFISTSNNKINGLQIGAFNESNHTKGLQLGIVNRSKDLRGIQFGVWNKNGRRSLPIVNWQFKKNKKKRSQTHSGLRNRT